MDGVWYVVGLMAFLVGVMGKRYIWSRSPSSSPKLTSSSNTYPDSGDLMTELIDKWSRPLSSLPVHVDIPRLARKITIYSSTSPSHINCNKQVVLEREENAPEPDTAADNLIIKDLLKTLASQLGEGEKEEKIENQFLEYFSKTADTSQALAEFLQVVVLHDSRTSRVLKACNQSVLAPGVLKLKFGIGNYYPYKDARGSWRIGIVVGAGWVSVQHSKREKSFDESTRGYFEFTWSLKLIFDCEDIELFVDDALLSDTMDPQIRKKVYAVLKPYFRVNDLIL